MHMPSDERNLLIKAHQGHEASARRLWDLHAPRLYLYAGAILHRRPDAEDAVQAAFCRMLQLPASRIREVREPGAFLARMVRSAALNAMRSTRRERRRVNETARPDVALDASGAADGPDPQLAAALASLPCRLREVVVLRHFAGLTFDALAEVLGVNRNTIAGRHRAAMNRLRALLDENAETAGAGKNLKGDARAPAANNLALTASSEVHHA